MVRSTSFLRLFCGVIMGPPGSGKGTVSERIIKEFGYNYKASGDLLRQHIQQGTPLGLQAKQYLDRGSLVPDGLVQELILDELTQIKSLSWLLDGFPRTVPQAQHLDANFNLSCAINLDVPMEIIIERISKRWVHPPSGRIYNTDFSPPKKAGLDDLTGEPLIQRADDKAEVVKMRLETYWKKTEPLLSYYRKRGILKEFKGKETNEIWPQIKAYLEDQ